MSEELQAIFHLEHIFKLCADKYLFDSFFINLTKKSTRRL